MGKMMFFRSIVLAVLLCFGVGGARAQAFEVGDNVFGVSVGVGGYYRAYNSYSSQTPSIGLHYERAVTTLGPGVLGLGGFVGFKSLYYRSNALWNGNPHAFKYDYQWTYLIIGFRGAWHYNEWHGVPELDTYGGLMLSFNSISYRDRTPYPDGVVSSYSHSNGGLGLTAFVGARYYFTPSVGAQLEIGYGISLLSLGVVFKF